MRYIRWYEKDHPCNGPFHWRWHASIGLIRLEHWIDNASSRTNRLRRRIERVADPVKMSD